jgi:D-glycero-D-manno-heptose 1,7-bisphosphate phosphatase
MKFEKSRAVFLDRDGTLCEEVGYLESIDQMKLIPRSGEAVRLLNQRGYKVVVITNQAGVARGFLSESRLAEIHAEMNRQLQEEGAYVNGIYYCPHHPTEGFPPYLQECGCRKPNTGLLHRAAEDLALELPFCYMIGDHFSDVECGQRVGAETVLLLTGHGREALAKRASWPREPSHIAENLYEAVQWIICRPERE